MELHNKSYPTISALFKRKGSQVFRVGREWQVDSEKWEQYLAKIASADKS